jgi:hypothetical protein
MVVQKEIEKNNGKAKGKSSLCLIKDLFKIS